MALGLSFHAVISWSGVGGIRRRHIAGLECIAAAEPIAIEDSIDPGDFLDGVLCVVRIELIGEVPVLRLEIIRGKGIFDELEEFIE